MLKSALLPLSLKESISHLKSMVSCLQYFGTESLTLLHVMESSSTSKHERMVDSLHTFAEEFREQGMAIQSIAKQGRIADTVCSTAQELEADFICLPWKKKNVISKALLGSSVSNILQMSCHPVFIYQKGPYLSHRKQLQRALYATDFQQTDSMVIPYLANRLIKADTLYLLHVGENAPDPYAEETRRQTARANLERLAGECSPDFSRVETLEVVGSITSQIARQAKRLKADLIILGKRDKKQPFEHIMGSVTESLPDKTRCCLFIVPGI